MQEFPIQNVDLLYGRNRSFESSNCVRGHFFTRDLLALDFGISATVLPSFDGVFEREISLFSVFVSTKRNLEARPRVTIPSSWCDSAISLGSNSRHSSTTSNLRFFDKEFSTAVSVEVTDSERNCTGSESTNVSIEDCEIDRFREWEDVAEDMSQSPGAIKVAGDNRMDEAIGRMASSSVEEGVGEEREEGGDLVDGVGFRRFLELALIAGPSSIIEPLTEATSEATPDVERDEGFDSTLARSAVHGSCDSRAFLPPRRVRFNGGSLSSGRLKYLLMVRSVRSPELRRSLFVLVSVWPSTGYQRFRIWTYSHFSWMADITRLYSDIPIQGTSVLINLGRCTLGGKSVKSDTMRGQRTYELSY